MYCKNKNNVTFEYYLIPDITTILNNELWGKTFIENLYSPTGYSWGTLQYTQITENVISKDGIEVLSNFYMLKDSNQTVFLCPPASFPVEYEII